MRTTTLGLLFFAACAPVGGGRVGNGPGSGSDGSGSDVAKCDNQVTISGDYTMDANDNVTISHNGDDLPSGGCYTIDGSLTITGSVDSLSGLGDVREVTDLIIDNTALEKIDTPNMIHVTGSLLVNHNDDLTDLTNLDFTADDMLTSVQITFNDSLTSMNRLNKLVVVDGPVEIGNNGSLTTVDLSAMDRVEGGLSIHDNAELTKLKLTKLSSVTMDLNIANNAALTSFGSLSLLTYVHGNFIIDNDDALVSLSDSMIAPMNSIDGNLVITNNALIGSTETLGQPSTALGMFSHPGHIGGQLTVTGNPDLLYCTAREIGCCVSHGSDVISANKTANDNGCAHSWCYASNGNSCPFQY